MAYSHQYPHYAEGVVTDILADFDQVDAAQYPSAWGDAELLHQLGQARRLPLVTSVTRWMPGRFSLFVHLAQNECIFSRPGVVCAVSRHEIHFPRGKTEPMGFQDAVLTGLAPDGGLLIPESIPNIEHRLAEWSALNYADISFEVFKLFTDIPEADLRKLVDDAYADFRHRDVAPTVKVGDVHILELFHGPTLAFKDMAMQFLSQVYDYVLEQRDQHINILGATSGDTGSAAIHGVRGKERIRIFMMHPKGRTSPLQEKQMTSVLDGNVFNLAVDGTFDDCQRIMKSIFGDVEFKSTHQLGAVNSVNWCRVLAGRVLPVFRVAGVEEFRCGVFALFGTHGKLW